MHPYRSYDRELDRKHPLVQGAICLYCFEQIRGLGPVYDWRGLWMRKAPLHLTCLMRVSHYVLKR